MENADNTLFVRRRLPWVLATVLALVYFLMLSHGLTFSSTNMHAYFLGWDWRPIQHAPIYYILTAIVRVMPAGLQVVALNGLSAVCAALTLALLARSVAILPHDRTREQRELEHDEHSRLSIRANWAPVVLAVLVCGLQLTFWENAIVASSEIFDLLIFAYVIWELLEFRIDNRDIRLYRMALIYGMSMVNNFAMIGFAPLFFIAVVWIKGFEFFNVRFLVRLALCALAGLLLYLVVPMVNMMATGSEQSYWEMLRMQLVGQKNALLGFPRFILVLIGLTSIFPVFFMGIKWPANFGDVSPIGTTLTNFMTHLIHGVFLVACIYVAFDPPFSPRSLGGSYPLLPFYYLGALSIGYFAGYALLVFSNTEVSVWRPKPNPLRKPLFVLARSLIWVALVAVPLGLAWLNMPKIRAYVSGGLSDLAQLTASQLPEKGCVVIADDPIRLYSVKSELHKKGIADRFIMLDSSSLDYPLYHQFLARKHGNHFPMLAGGKRPGDLIDSGTQAMLLSRLGEQNPLYYLHPSFGFYFETFYLQPQNLIYRLERLPTNIVQFPFMSQEALRSNDAFWQGMRKGLLSGLIQKIKAAEAEKKDKKPNPALHQTETWMGMFYARAINYLGVEFQRAGDLNKAAEYFSLALELNPDSPTAFVNRDWNAILRSGKKQFMSPSEGALKRIRPYEKNWDLLMSINGPYDEPNSCYLYGVALVQGGNFRQASHNLMRTITHDPDHIPAHLALAGALVNAQMVGEAMKVITETRERFAQRGLGTNEMLILAQVEAWAKARNRDIVGAEKILLDVQRNFPGQSGPFATLAEIYVNAGQMSNALAVLERQLKVQPEDVDALANTGALKIRAGQINDAIPYLDRALKLQPRNPYALLNRAIAFLQTGKVDQAERDYVTLERLLPRPPHTVYYGLGETAKLKKNYKEALEYYDKFLKLAPPGTPEINYVNEQIKLLKRGS